jgi:hypothetical protein
MSRPFSYNDENFTVIGNVLFCHIKIRKAILKSEPIVEIPPEIYAHMLFNTQKFTEEAYGTGFICTGPAIDVGVKKQRTENTFYLLKLISMKPVIT